MQILSYESAGKKSAFLALFMDSVENPSRQIIPSKAKRPVRHQILTGPQSSISI